MNKDRMNILVIGQSYLGRIGGVPKFYAQLYDYLCARGHAITHVTFLPIGKEGLQYPFPESVKIISINIYAGHGVADRIRNIANEVNPDVVVLMGGDLWNLDALAALRSSPFPVIISERGCPPYCITKMWMNRRLRELAAGQVEFYHLLMPSFKNSFPKDLQNWLVAISNPEPEAKILAKPDIPDENGKFTLLYTGRLAVEKRLPLLVRAFALVCRHYPEWRLEIIGSGPELGLVKAAIAEAKIENRVYLLPNTNSQDALARHYADSHLFCLPSEAEGCPHSLLEALAAGLPCVGFASCPGTNDIIKDGYNGFLAKADTAESLAHCLEKLMGNVELRVKMGENAINTAKGFAPEKNFAAWEKLLREASLWKGRKKILKFKRMLQSPVASLWRALQPVPKNVTNLPDIFCRSPLDWFRQVGEKWLDYALLNFFGLPHFPGQQKPADVLARKSRIVCELNKPESMSLPGMGAVARNILKIANRNEIGRASCRERVYRRV